VFANDLNPESFKWLKENVKLNKVAAKVQCHNLDGREFIRTVIANNIDKCEDVHITMNLPAMASEFLDAFREIKSDCRVTVHCYCFVKFESDEDDAKQMAVDLITKDLGEGPFTLVETKSYFVRRVSPGKDMMRVTFRLQFTSGESSVVEPESKKAKLEEL